VVAENNNGTTRSDIGTFRTQALPTIPNTPVTTVTHVVTSGGPGDLVTLDIDNNQEIATRGQFVQYEVTYGNTSSRDLENVGLYITLPKVARFISSTDGVYTRRDHAVYEAVGDLDAGEEEELTITVRIGGASDGEPVVAEAILAFESTEDGDDALLNAIEFDSDTYSAAGFDLAAGLFGLEMPTTFVGWLILLFVLVLIILLAQYLYRKYRENHARSRAREAYYRRQMYANADMNGKGRNGDRGNGNGVNMNGNDSNGSDY
jgi:uncharacterized membrane protein